MKKICLFLSIILLSSYSFSQGMFTKKKNFSFDFGFGYVYYSGIGSSFGSLAYNLSTSILGVVDIGGVYTRESGSNGDYKKTEGGTGFLDFYAKKDSVYGIVLNTAISTVNYQSAFLAGLSVYGRFINQDNSIGSYPFVSVGILTTENLSLGLGVAFEKSFGEKLSIVATTGVNTALSLKKTGGNSGNPAQVAFTIECIFKTNRK